jgi:phosphomannomutase
VKSLIVFDLDGTLGESKAPLDSETSALLHDLLEIVQVAVISGAGEAIEDRGSQITYSALGQQAPSAEKNQWDPDFAKRQKIKTALDAANPVFSIRLGGLTSIDVTKPGVDKAYGIRKLRAILGISLRQMTFIGDALFVGENDCPAEQAGVTAIPVRGLFNAE